MAGTQASKTVLKIYYRSSLIYLVIVGAVVETTAIRSFALRGPTGYLENSDLGGEEESRRVIERRSWRGWLRPWIKIILALIFF